MTNCKDYPDTEAMRFILRAQDDAGIKEQLIDAFESGSNATMEHLVAIGNDAGFVFSIEDFCTTMRAILEMRYAAGELDLEEIISADDPPESSCAKGCLSWTVNWHPSNLVIKGRPLNIPGWLIARFRG